MKTHPFILLVLMLFPCFNALSQTNQDKVYLIDNSFLEGKVTEIREDVVVLQYNQDESVRELPIEKSQIAKIVYSNGYEEVYNQQSDAPQDREVIEQTEEEPVSEEEPASEESAPPAVTPSSDQEEDHQGQNQSLIQTGQSQEVDILIYRSILRIYLSAGYSQLLGADFITDAESSGLGLSGGFNAALQGNVNLPIPNLAIYANVGFTQWRTFLESESTRNKLHNIRPGIGIQYHVLDGLYLAGDVGLNHLKLINDQVNASVIDREIIEDTNIGFAAKLGYQAGKWDFGLKYQLIPSIDFITMQSSVYDISFLLSYNIWQFD